MKYFSDCSPFSPAKIWSRIPCIVDIQARRLFIHFRTKTTLFIQSFIHSFKFKFQAKIILNERISPYYLRHWISAPVIMNDWRGELSLDLLQYTPRKNSFLEIWKYEVMYMYSGSKTLCKLYVLISHHRGQGTATPLITTGELDEGTLRQWLVSVSRLRWLLVW